MPGPDLVDIRRTSDGLEFEFRVDLTIPVLAKGSGRS